MESEILSDYDEESMGTIPNGFYKNVSKTSKFQVTLKRVKLKEK